MCTREEQAVAYFNSGYNCAQAVLGAFSAELGLDQKTAFKLANGFGGGLRCGEICGAVSGAVMAIGLKCGFYVDEDFQQKGYCNLKSYEFIEKLKEKNGSVLCRELLEVDIQCPNDHSTSIAQEAHKSRCPHFVASAVQILESMEIDAQSTI